MRRPGPLRWLWYALGGGLPAEHRSWVLHDVTARHWRWRALLRSVVQIAPVALLLYLLLPTPPWVRLMAVGGGLLVGMIFAVAYLDESTEHRAVKAGYPRGTATQIRTAPDEDAELHRRDRRRGDGQAATGSPE
jgi:hypothetical protein